MCYRECKMKTRKWPIRKISVLQAFFSGGRDEGSGDYLVECDAYMLNDPNESVGIATTKVLKAFGRQYQRMLRRVKSLAEKSSTGETSEE